MRQNLRPIFICFLGVFLWIEGSMCQAATSVPSSVVWTNLKNVTVTGTSLKKTSGSDNGMADAGAVSQQAVLSSDGFLEFTIPQAKRGLYIGFGNSATTYSTNMLFGIECYDNYAEVRESRTYRTDISYKAGDRFRIAVESAAVKYYKNGSLFYTSKKAPVYPLIGTVSLSVMNTAISDAVIGTGSGTVPPPPVSLPVIVSFSATPASITVGQSSTLGWNVTNATSLSLNQGIGVVTGTSKVVSPTSKTSYILTATNSAGSVTQSVDVTVSSTPNPTPPPTLNFTASPDIINAGKSSTLTWSTTNATACTASNGWSGSKATSGSLVVTPSATAVYALDCTGAGGSTGKIVGVTVQQSPVLPVISSFSASPNSISTGQSSTLSWVVSGSTSLSLSQGIGTVTGTTKTISPTSTTTYVLTATNAAGSVTASATVSLQISGGGGLSGLPGVADDGRVHAPPTSGSYAYSLPGAFLPRNSGFISTGQSYTDPVYGSKITRLSNVYPSEGSGLIYGKNGFWNADSTKYVADDAKGTRIIDAATGATIRDSVSGNQGDCTFDPVDSDAFYFPDGSKLQRLSVSTGAVTTLKDFGQTLGSMGGTEDTISADGRYFLVILGTQIRIWDKQADTLYTGSVTALGPADGGWVGIAPDGSGFVDVTGTKKSWYAINHTAKSISTTGFVFLDQPGDHSTLMSASDGQTYLVKPEFNNTWAIYAHNVRTGAEKLLLALSQQVGWCDDTHYTSVARGPLKDWALIDTEITNTGDACANADSGSNPTASWWPHREEIFMINVLTGEIRSIAHHRSRSNASYCTMPRINVNWDGTAAMFASNYGETGVGGSCGYSDMYKVDLKNNS